MGKAIRRNAACINKDCYQAVYNCSKCDKLISKTFSFRLSKEFF